MRHSWTLQLVLLIGIIWQTHHVIESLKILLLGDDPTTNLNQTAAAIEYPDIPNFIDTKEHEHSDWSPLNEVKRFFEGTHEGNQSSCDNDEELYFIANKYARPAKRSPKRKIPKIVHVTGRTRCLTKPFYDNLRHNWHLTKHSFVFHDEEAVDALLSETWPDFPHLHQTIQCLHPGGGAAKADLWRYLVLWKYGGIYADMDSAPGRRLFQQDKKNDNQHHSRVPIISDTDDAFFIVEDLGILSQYFMAVSPKHPLMYFAIQHTLHRLMSVSSIGEQYVPFVTGPGALKAAFITFMGEEGTGRYNKVEAGLYYYNRKQPEKRQITDRSVTVVGRRKTSSYYVDRNGVKPADKQDGYAKMGMVHFSKAKDPSQNISCFAQLYDHNLRGL